MIHLSYFRCLNSDGNIPCSACLFLSVALRWDQGDKLKYRHLPDHMNPTHQISRASTPHFPLYGAATQTFPLLTSCVCWVRLWRNAIWGCQGGVTSARRAWLDTGGFLSHGRSRCLLSCNPMLYWLMSHTQEKISALPAENSSPFFPFPGWQLWSRC